MHTPRSRAWRWVLARICGDPPSEAYLINETGTEVGPWFVLANELVGIVVDELRDRDDVLARVMREIDAALR
jgi:hypothetical protein